MRKKEGNKKQAIFDATLRLITERGFHATPTSLIAKEAGIATGTLYLYFDSKNDLLNKLYIKVKTHMAEGWTEGLSSDATIQEGLELLWRNMLNHRLSYPIEFAFVEQFENSPLLDQATLEARREMFEPVYVLFAQALAKKVIKDMSKDIVTSLFMAPIVYFAKQHIREKTMPSEEMISILYQGCWDAIKR
ncbi:MAG: TetR/AcrR family transcriptional regulator [Ardenticatenaceae bacterium]